MHNLGEFLEGSYMPIFSMMMGHEGTIEKEHTFFCEVLVPNLTLKVICGSGI
jgi:hypothetical protein